MLHKDHHIRTEKYRPCNKVSCHRVHSKRRQLHHEGTEEPHSGTVQWDSGNFITSGQGMGYPPKTFIDSDSDGDIPPHVPKLEEYCKTCISKRQSAHACPCLTGLQN